MESIGSRQRVPADGPDVPDVHVAGRALPNLLILWTLNAVLVAGLFTPSISARVGLDRTQGLLVAGSFLSVSSLAFLSYHRFGAGSCLFRCLDYLESLVVNGCIAYLIHASGTALSFFWVFHLVHVLLAGFARFSLRYVFTISVGPACLVVAFLLRGDAVSGWLSALGGLSGLVVYANIARLFSHYLAAVQREAGLREALARVLVARERTRISRDLHDNVTTELTALVWRVREISDTLLPGPEKRDIHSVAERLRGVIEDVRNAVLALRGPILDFEELKRLLENRARELCSSRLLSVEIDGELSDAELPAFQTNVLPICFELVHNAVSHSGAKRVSLSLQIGPVLRLRVEDDGAGLPEGVQLRSRGGLRGVKARVERLRGRFELHSSASGTHFSLEFPRPLQLEAFL
jgi:signal transduction histidine kinase